MGTWLITGGAGYIGAHVARAVRDAGLIPVVLDDLSTGRREFVPDGVAFVEGSILDTALLERTLRESGATGVIHVAGMKFAGLSVQQPLHAYDVNAFGTASLLRAMAATGVERLVFSSSCAVYGTPAEGRVTESTPLQPESPYGRSKLVAEWLIRDQAAASALRHVSLRYFNVVGSGPDGVWDSSPYNLFPLIFRALLAGRTPRIHGTDYATPDGTCIRDYLDVEDLARTHVAAALALEDDAPVLDVYNLGSGRGSSVREIMAAAAAATGIAFEPDVGPRRAGDPARIVAVADAATRDLGWSVTKTLEEMILGAWAAHRTANG